MGPGLQQIALLALVSGVLFIVISVLVLAPGWTRDARYRPGLVWAAAPIWFHGPGGAYRAAVPELVLTERRPWWVEAVSIDAARLEAAAEPNRHVGGASAGW